MSYHDHVLEEKELLKIVILLFLYGVAAPLLGVLLWWQPAGQRWAFAVLCFMTTGGFLRAEEWGFTLGFIEYRGHTAGYHFFFAEVFALSLIIARFLQDRKKFRWLPPGLWLYFLYCALSFISIINAPQPDYVFMAAFKMVKAALFFVAAYNFLKDERDLHFFLKAMSATMLWQLVVVLKMKYLDGIYQVPGTFEHQNSLSMFTTMIGMVLLGATLGPKHRSANIYLLGFLACAVVQQSTFSRAGLAVFGAGTLAVCLVNLLERFDRRRLAVLAILSVTGVTGLLLAMDTIVERFQEAHESSAETRSLLNIASSQMLQDYPLGIGWNNYGLAINKPFPYGRVIDEWERAGGATVDEDAPKGISESHYWLLLAETGYQGLIAYLFFILLFLWWNFRAAFFYRYHFIGSLSVGIAAGCGANYTQAFLERVLTQPRSLMLWMLLLGLTARIESWRRIEAKSLKTPAKSPPEPAAKPRFAYAARASSRRARPFPSSRA